MKEYEKVKINENSIIPEYNGIIYTWKDGRKPRIKNTLKLNDKKFWWIVGRYIGDGWFRYKCGIIICCAIDELNEITSVLDNYINYNVVLEKTVYKVHIPDKELSTYLEQFGKGAINKHLTQDVLNLPTDLLKSFLEGYLSADGYCKKNLIQCNSVSLKLIYGIWHCIMKVYRVPVYVYKVAPAPKKVICGRTVNQNAWYQLRTRLELSTRNGFYKDGYIYYDKKTSFIQQDLFKGEQL